MEGWSNLAIKKPNFRELYLLFVYLIQHDVIRCKILSSNVDIPGNGNGNITVNPLHSEID